MSEHYRLVYSGEVLEGQHAAVVKKRLQGLLKLDDARMDVLFSGKAVVVKKATDESNAVRYQAAFEKAGARLRVLPVDAEDPIAEARPEDAATASTPAAQPSSAPPPTAGTGELNVLPPGSDVLSADERPETSTVEVDTSHLAVQGATFAVDDGPLDTPTGPNVDHISLAELGVQLGRGDDADNVVVAEIEVDFDLADVGATIGSQDAADVVAPVDMDKVDFDLADTGTALDPSEKPPPPPAPDTSHLHIEEDDKA